ncbi:hypothetical protein MSP8887_03706 [Marinomonas spartinae]|uniref:hypothetical protein n=1 Tax=Marinomonas spartinae TaxID=1792290 RepID=UPI000809041C|nr:hypothetical protein [Marinomonas spartinae]SBS39204.1 hypothetical protein MSP8887_03706 [Marinomonas spartinae]
MIELKVSNNSLNLTTFIVFMSPPTPKLSIPSKTYTLAWQTKTAFSGVTVNFSWDTTYNVVWSQPGDHLKIGTICDTHAESKYMSNPNSAKILKNKMNRLIQTRYIEATSSQSIPVEINGLNSTSLSFHQDLSAYNFLPLSEGPKGTITTNCGDDVPSSQTTSAATAAGLGVGLSGYGAFLVDAQPNLQCSWTISELTYYLAYGEFKTGEIIDPAKINSKIIVNFDGVNKREAVLDKKNKIILL